MEYILIFSIENENSTTQVIEWLNYYNEKYIRINNGKFNLHKLLIGNIGYNFEFEYQNTLLNSDNIKSFWYRRGNIQIKFDLDTKKNENEILRTQIQEHLELELNSLRDSVYLILDEKKHINSYHSSSTNKLKTLIKARELGLNIPETLIANSKDELDLFYRKNNKIITKGIQECEIFLWEDNNKKPAYFGLHTIEINSDKIKKIDNNFFYSSFQEKLNKAFELRVFF